MIFISIIVPVYNTEKYLQRCIDSILRQTYKYFELILIDDGSTDNSPSICDSYLSLDNRVVVRHIKNKGVANARNIGMKISKYKHFMFVDSDDWIEENMLEEMCKYAETCDLVIAGLEVIYPSFKNVYIPKRQERISMNRFYDDFTYFYKSTIINSPCAKIYNKRTLSDLNFDTSIRAGEDFDFNLKYFDRCNSITITDKTKYIYDCTNSLSATKKYHEGAIEEIIQVNKKGFDFCQKHGIGEQSDCLDDYLCKNGIHMLDIIANSEMSYRKKYRESSKLLSNTTFINECKTRRKDDSLKLSIEKKLCLLRNYGLLLIFFQMKNIVKKI